MSVEPWIDAWPRSAMMPPPGPADVAEQQLEDRRGADVLDADGVLRPADRVDRSRAVRSRPGVGAQRLGDREELAPRCSRRPRRPARACSARSAASGSGRRSAGAAASGPPRAARRARAPRRAPPCAAARPASSPCSRSPAAAVRLHALRTARSRVVLAASRLPAREEAVEILGVAEVLVDDHAARSCSCTTYSSEPPLVLEDVVDDPAEEGDVASRPGCRHVRRHRARAGEAGVDVDHLRAALARLHHPLEADRVVLGHVRAHDHDAVRVRPGPAGSRWPRPVRTRSPDRGPWSCVICGPGSRPARRRGP